ncbi:MAG: ABC transporter permease [Anaerolineae bacterium]|nr:ABC transporter permease [Anaerolineae bacterium]
MSTFFENIRVALLGLRSNKLRSLLTMLGITIGVFAVIVLVSVGQGVETFVRERFQGIGANLLFVIGQADAQGRIPPLTQNDYLAINDPYRVPDAIAVMPQRNVTRSVTVEGRELSIPIQGVLPVYQSIFSRKVVAGRFIDQNDVDSTARVAILGQDVVSGLFPETNPIGQTIRIADVRFTVIGVLEKLSGGGFGAPGTSQDRLIIVPITTAQTRLSNERVITGDRIVNFVVVQAKDSSRVDEVAQQIRLTLREEREINFRDEDTFQVFTQTELLDTFGSVTALITVFLGVLAGISLLVGGIGIMNIMLVTVTERTREIGLRKAVGAQKGDILLQFLTEATVLALTGGLAGILLSILAAGLVAAVVPDLDVYVQFSSVLLATLISALIGIFFGIYPANRAASLNPIDALRYE